MSKKRSTLESLRKKTQPRKRRGDSSQKNKEFAVVRVPMRVKEELSIVRLAYGIMWSSGGNDVVNLTHENLDDWSPEHITEEVFYLRLIDGALRIDPGLKRYLPLAREVYPSLAEKKRPTRQDEEMAVKEVLLRKMGKKEAVPKEVVEKPSEEADKSSASRSSVSLPVDNGNSEKDQIKESVYWFVKGDERLVARISKGKGSFAVDYDGRPQGFDFMIKHGWNLEDKDGNTIDRETALAIKKEKEKANENTNDDVPTAPMEKVLSVINHHVKSPAELRKEAESETDPEKKKKLLERADYIETLGKSLECFYKAEE